MQNSLYRIGGIAAVLLMAHAASTSAQDVASSRLVQLEALQRQVAALERLAPAGSLAPPAADDPARPILERLDELSTEIRIIARQIEIDKEQEAERGKAIPLPAASRGGFSLQSADGNFRLRLRGYVQSDGRFFPRDVEQRSVDSFLLRRVRPIVEATMYGIFDVRVMPDFGGGTTVLQDAYLEARLRPGFKIRTGKFKPPVGIERLMSASEMPFIERALPTALVPNRDLGLMVHGDVAGSRLAYAVGVFNGVADGGSGDADIEDGKEVDARLFAQPFRTNTGSVGQGFGFGLSGTYGEQHASAVSSTGLPVFRTAGQSPFFAFRGDDPVLGPVLANGTHARVSLQGHYYVGPFGILAEQVRSWQLVRRSTTVVRPAADAWQVHGCWVLTGESPSSRGVTPRAPFDVKAGTWGAVEVVARYSTLHVSPEVFPLLASPASQSRGAEEWVAGVNWILNTTVKVQANLEHTRFATAGAGHRRPENGLLTRVQFAF